MFTLEVGTDARTGTVGRPETESRKTATIVFTDVVGSTSLAEQVDPEVWSELVLRYFERMRSAIEAHGGAVEKFVGDAILAVFGVPTMHEDDALRAVRAACDMRDALSEFNRELASRVEIELQTRTGVNTGEIVVGGPTDQILPLGDAANTAARLEQSAAPGEMLIGGPTFRLVRKLVRVEPVTALVVKGKEEPLEAYRLLGLASTAVGVAGSTPFVGRGDELERVLSAVRAAFEAQRFALILLVGAAGLGKSRLLREVAASLSHDARVVTGRCLPYGEGITYWPVAEVVGQLAGFSEVDARELATGRLQALVGDRAGGPRIASLVAGAIGLQPAAGTAEEANWGIRTLLEIVATERPLLVGFEDLHWAEAAFLDVVEHLTQRARDVPMVVLCTARPDLWEAREDWPDALAGRLVIELEPLTGDSGHAFIDAFLGGSELPDRERESLVLAADGNPLFLEELLGMLVDDGLLRRDTDGWVMTADIGSLDLPPTVSALLGARLDRLEPRNRRLLQCASVVGRVFSTDALEALLDDAGTDVDDRMAELVGRGFVEDDPSSLAGKPALRFRHVLITEAAYTSAPKALRADLHERFARWLEQTSGDRAEEVEEFLGYHLEQAHRYRTELRHEQGRVRLLAERAGRHLSNAGRRASMRGDFAAAVGLWSRALALLRITDAERGSLVAELVEALAVLGRMDEAKTLLLEVGARGEARDAWTTARLELASLMLEGERESRVDEERVSGLIPVFEEMTDGHGLARAWRLSAHGAVLRGRYADAERSFLASAKYSRDIGDLGELGQSLAYLTGVYSLGPTPVQEALERCWEVVRANPEGSLASSGSLGSIARLEGLCGRFADARAAAEQGIGNVEELGLRLVADTLRAELCWFIDLLEGRLEDVRTTLEGIHARWPDVPEYQDITVPCLARVARALGDTEALGRHVEELPPLLGTDVGYTALGLSISALYAADIGDQARATQLAQESVATLEDSDALNVRGLVLVDVAEVLEIGGELDGAVETLREALRLFERKGATVSAGVARERLVALGSMPDPGT